MGVRIIFTSVEFPASGPRRYDTADGWVVEVEDGVRWVEIFAPNDEGHSITIAQVRAEHVLAIEFYDSEEA